MKGNKPRNLLVVRLDIQPERDECWWLPVAAAPRRISLEEAAHISQRVPAVVLLDHRAIRLDWLERPPGVKNSEAALLLEDLLCQPLDEVDVSVLQNQGRRLQTAVVDQQQAQDWQQRLQQVKLRVARWIPEALCVQQAWQKPEALLLEEPLRHWLYLPDQQQLLAFSPAWLSENQLNHWVGDRSLIRLTPEDLPSGSVVVWLAQHLPRKITLWKATAASSRLQGFKRWPWQPLRPWLLLVLLLLVLQGTKLLLPSSANPPRSVDTASLELLEARLERSIQQRHWQQQRLDAWRELQAYLDRAPHLKLQQLSLDQQGIRVVLVGVKSADQSALNQLPGRWQFSEQQGIWERAL